MVKSYTPPHPSSLSPLLRLLPDIGCVTDLEKLIPSLFARIEKVRTLRRSGSKDSLPSSRERRVSAEEVMLRNVLEWLDVSVEDEKVK